MDIDEEKRKFVNLLKSSFQAQSDYKGLLLGDNNPESITISQKILSKYGFNDRDFWEIICPALKKEGFLKNYIDPWLSSIYQDAYENDSRYKNLKEEYRKLDTTLPPSLWLAREVSSQKTLEGFLSTLAATGSEKDQIRRVEKQKDEIRLKLDKIEDYIKDNFYHKFVINSQKLNSLKSMTESKEKDLAHNVSKSGIFFEVGGDMINHGTMKTDQHSTVGIAVAGNYSSNDKTKVIQGDVALDKKEWYEKPLGISLIAVTTTIIAAGIIFLLGWN